MYVCMYVCRSLESRGISNELYFGIKEGVEEKEGASIDQSIILDYLGQSWWGKQKCPAIKAVFSSLIFLSIFNYYINTNEVPGELSRENLVSSHVKITCYLHMWKYHRCYGYIINRAFHTKKLLKWNGLVFH